MEITTTNIYWLFVVLPNIKVLMVIFGSMLALFSTMAAGYGLMTWEQEADVWKKNYKRWLLTLAVFGILAFFLQAFIPSKQDLVLMYGLPRALDNENVQQLPDNAVEYINTWLEQNTESLREEK